MLALDLMDLQASSRHCLFLEVLRKLSHAHNIVCFVLEEAPVRMLTQIATRCLTPRALLLEDFEARTDARAQRERGERC